MESSRRSLRLLDIACADRAIAKMVQCFHDGFAHQVQIINDKDHSFLVRLLPIY